MGCPVGLIAFPVIQVIYDGSLLIDARTVTEVPQRLRRAGSRCVERCSWRCIINRSFAWAKRHNYLMGNSLSGVSLVDSSRRPKCHQFVESVADETRSGVELPSRDSPLTPHTSHTPSPHPARTAAPAWCCGSFGNSGCAAHRDLCSASSRCPLRTGSVSHARSASTPRAGPVSGQPQAPLGYAGICLRFGSLSFLGGHVLIHQASE